MDFASYIPALALPSLDIIIIAGVFGFIALDAMRSGTDRAAAVVIALLSASLLTNLLWSAAFVGASVAGLAATVHAGIFGAVAVIAFLLAGRIVRSVGGGGFIQAALAAFSATAIALVIWHMTPALFALWDFNAAINAIFAEGYRFWWIAVSLALLAFARG